MLKLALIFSGFLSAFPVIAAPNVPLTVQEALFPGDATGKTYSSPGGITRNNEPFCMGVPLADAENIQNGNVLGLNGATAGQFRVLGKWPSGNAKWVKVCGIVSSLAAGGNTIVTLIGGTGDFGGPSLATDNGTTIAVDTGTAVFAVKKANFNVIDTAVVGGKTIVASSASQDRGFVMLGPNPTATYPANVTCGTGPGQSPCTTIYSSANDPNSSCSIEENGPVMTTLRCVGTHFDSANHPYMQFTARLQFYKSKSHVKVTSILRNANYDSATDAAGNTFNSAFKGFESYDLRIAPNLSGPLNYTIAADSTACAAGICTGTLSGMDAASIYQARSTLMAQQTDCGVACVEAFTKDLGYTVRKNSTVIASNTDGTKAPAAFYADIADSTGAGIQIGIYQGASYWPKSLEFNGGGADLRIGIWPAANSQPVYQAWPSSSVHDLYLNFHASNPGSLANSFLSFQHYLLARADRTYYNATQVFPYALPDASREDAFYKSINSTASYADGTRPLASMDCCTVDLGTAHGAWQVQAYRFKFWPDSGPANQEEFRWSNLMRFLRSGQTGRFMDSAHFYRLQTEKAWPHADGVNAADSTVNGFHWRNKASNELDGWGRPRIACGGTYAGDTSCTTLTNAGLAFQSWYDMLHFHWYGMTDYYFLTGDETLRESMVPVKDWYMNNATYQGGASGGIGIIRGVGIEMLSAARLATYLRAIGDPDHAAVLTQAEQNFALFVKPEGCMNGYPAGCTMPAAEPVSSPAADPPGVSRLRGAPASVGGRGGGRCGLSPTKQYRGIATFYASLMVEGLIALREAKGPGWPDYNLALDLAYGIGQYTLTEMFQDDGGSYFWKGGGINGTRTIDTLYNGFMYSSTYDVPYACPDGTPVLAGTTAQYANGGPVLSLYNIAAPTQGMFMNFYVQALVNGALSTDDIRKLKIAIAWIRGQGQSSSDLGQYQIASVFQAIDEGASSLRDVPFTVQPTATGTYRLTWTSPSGIQSGRAPSPYRIKWSPKIIAPSTAGTYPGFGKVNGLLNYDPMVTGKFGLDPNVYTTWFGAETTSEPAALTPGQVQTFDITTGVSGLTAQNFSVKAYFGSGTVPPPPPASATATDLRVSGYPASVTTGVSKAVTVTAVDANGAVVTGYIGTVRLTSSDPAATLPSQYTFTATDAGVHTFQVTLNTAGTGRSITATDVANASVSGAQTGIDVVAAPSAGAANLTYVSGNNQQGSVQATATGGITWTRKLTNNSAWAGATGFAQMFYDAATNRTVYYGVPIASSSIYASDIYFYNSGDNTFTHGPGTGVMKASCTADSATQPGERHPYWQMAIDTKRNIMWLAGGVNEMCNGNSAGPDGSPRQDTYYLKLNASNPAQSAWQRVNPVHPLARLAGTITYDSDNDVLVYFGYPADRPLFVYCPTINPATGVASGVLTSNQTAAGCTAADDWNEVVLKNGTVKTNGTAVTFASGSQFTFFAPGDWMMIAGGFHQVASIQDSTHLTLASSAGVLASASYAIVPPGTNMPGLVYDTATKKVILFGGSSVSTYYNQTWAYDVLARKWTHKALSTQAPPFENTTNKFVPQPEMVYDPVGQQIYYHYVGGTAAPSDWRYDPVADTWMKLSSTGTGPTRDSMATFDPICNCLITLSNIGGQGSPVEIWQGSLGQSTTGQSTTGETLANPLVVKVTSGSGVAVAGVPVTFSVTSTSGTLGNGVRQEVVNSDAQGLAATTLTLGQTAGTYTVTAASGTLTGSPVTFTATGTSGGLTVSRCDVNADGASNAVDVQLAVSQTLGTTACGSADLDGDSRCTVTDVQRFINASLGSTCRIGP
jgi:hypothetical protein